MNRKKAGPQSEQATDPLSVLVYRRCRRKCPVCAEKEKKVGLSDDDERATTTCSDCLELERKQPLDGVLARRVMELEGTVAKQEKIISKLQDSMYDLRHDNKELLKTMEGLKNLPKASDIEALKNLCALVAGESRDSLHNLKTRTEKKLKATESYLDTQATNIKALQVAVQQLDSHNTSTGNRVLSLETAVSSSESNKLAQETVDLRSKLKQVEEGLVDVKRTLSRQEDDRRKKKPVIDVVKEEINRLKQTVHTEHADAIRRLQKQDSASRELDLSAMEKSLRNALAHNSAQRGGPAYADDIEKVKKHIRNVEKRLNSIDSDSKNRSRLVESDVKLLSQTTADSIQMIVDHINTTNQKYDKYIPSFPEYSFHSKTLPVGKTSVQDVLDATAPAGLGMTGSVNAGSGGGGGGSTAHHSYIEDGAAFDDYVRTSFDMEKMLAQDKTNARGSGAGEEYHSAKNHSVGDSGDLCSTFLRFGLDVFPTGRRVCYIREIGVLLREVTDNPTRLNGWQESTHSTEHLDNYWQGWAVNHVSRGPLLVMNCNNLMYDIIQEEVGDIISQWS